MCAHGRLTNGQQVRDLAVTLSLGYQAQHLDLAAGQGVCFRFLPGRFGKFSKEFAGNGRMEGGLTAVDLLNCLHQFLWS